MSACLAVFITIFLMTSLSDAAKPNVVLIVADDLGFGDLACYGSETNHTPHLDALAKGGVRFTDFHSSGPMCTPTRVSLLTGRYQQRFGSVFDGPLSGETQRALGLPSSAITIAEVLKEVGYQTACFGKWHLGFQKPFLPNNQGFGEFRGLLAGDGDHHSHIDRYGNEDWWHNDQAVPEVGYTADLLTRHSVEFIEQHRASPFFLYVPHLAIHFPWQAPHDPPHRKKGTNYKQDKWGVIPNPQNVQPHVKGMVEAIDKSTGAIVAALQRLRLVKNTLIIFTSDNGGYLNYGTGFQNISSNGPYRGQKGTLYEGGHRVPLIVSFAEKIQPNVSNAIAHSNDILPTIASIAGVNANKYLTDGVDLSNSLLHDLAIRPRTLFWRAGNEWAVRDGAYKLVYEQGRVELFDLVRDPSEQVDLAARKPGVAKRLRKKWHAWNAEMPNEARP